MLGLRFYMDCEIEDIHAGDLEDELQEDERRFWAVNPELDAEFTTRMKANGRQVERVADLPDRWRVYRERGAAQP